MTGLDFRHNMDVVRDQNGSYSAHVFADRAVQLVRQHAIYSKGQVSTVTLYRYNVLFTKENSSPTSESCLFKKTLV